MSVSQYRKKAGTTIRLGIRLGEGAEGTIFDVAGDPHLAAKIYKQGLASEREGKVVAMIEARLHESKFVAYPIDALFDIRSNAFVGFTMRKARERKAVHELYSPSSRKTAFPSATFPLLVRSMSNVACAMAAVHASGCVIGDVNHSGVMVAADGTVTLIDSDSFQYTFGGKTFSCKVGTPDFTPPELQAKPFKGIVRTPNHDAFGLATLIFMTLYMGRFPFVGRYKGVGEMPPIERLIAEFRFAYSSRRAALQMEPPPHVPTLADLPLPLADAFERAFGPVGASPSGRPSAADWYALLERSEAELVPCNRSVSHHHFRQASSCPWCRMEQAFPGFVSFVPTVTTISVDLSQLIAAVRGVLDPGPVPELATLMPLQSDPQPSAAAAQAKKKRSERRFWGLGCIVAGLAFCGIGGGGIAAGMMLFAVACGLLFTTPEAFVSIREKAKSARTEWETACKNFDRIAGNDAFLKTRKDAETLIQKIQALPAEEARKLAGLEAKRRELQLRRHLERFKVNQAKVSGVGEARKLTLRSYGIETAVDIEYRRIVAIKGFGPSTANNLVKWRRIAEAKFVFDPGKAIDAQDIAAVKFEIARNRTDLVARLKQTVGMLQKLELEAKASRTKLDPGYPIAWKAFRQAEVDLKALGSI